MKLTILIPAYNEKTTLEQVVERALALPLDKEIILVDDGSDDGTAETIKAIANVNSGIIALMQDKNRGKGAAVRAGIERASGDILVIQDADLEYSPEDIPELIKPIAEGWADAVYGSRFLGVHRVFKVWHYLGNRFLTIVANILYDTMLTDMETGYKAFRTDILKSIKLRSNRFDIEPEITAKVFKRRLRIYEMPITYRGRDYDEGKKITAWDGFPALWALIKYRFID